MAMRAFMIQHYEISDKQNNLMNFFKKADVNHDGMINKKELQMICEQSGVSMDI